MYSLYCMHTVPIYAQTRHTPFQLTHRKYCKPPKVAKLPPSPPPPPPKFKPSYTSLSYLYTYSTAPFCRTSKQDKSVDNMVRTAADSEQRVRLERTRWELELAYAA